MKRYSISVVFILVFAAFTFAQDAAAERAETYVAPTKWERYALSGEKVSLLFPKMPVMVEYDDPCRQTGTESYYAYADRAVYEIKIAKNLGRKANCRPKMVKFGKNSLQRRLKETASREGTNSSVTENAARKAYKFERSDEARLIVDDMENGRWIELAVHFRPGTSVDTARFFDSFQSVLDGIELKDGAERTLGDVDVQGTAGTDAKDDGKLRLIAKPKAEYTQHARRRGTQGTVRLNVTFLASGGIGKVEVVSGLPHGLTKRAVAAAKRLVFLPAEDSGKPKSLTKMVEYNFSLY